MTKKIEPNLDDPVICYVLVRTDTPGAASIGRMCAQTHHNGTEMTEDLLEKDFPDLNKLYAEWKDDRKFGTVLTLAVTAAQMRQAVSLAQLLGLHSKVTHDPTYPIADGDRYTTAPVDSCAYIFGRKSSCQPVVGLFPLLHERHMTDGMAVKGIA